ncbi:hypothetical protein DFS34DRAFT_655350 [Phlyctochytrium arcticum]|nr:hypothetical protein DFS34DRAFT_655350 [Phlyctochytrium arcticum]
MNMDQNKLRASIKRTWYEMSDQEQLREELSDVSIEVYPEDKLAEVLYGPARSVAQGSLTSNLRRYQVSDQDELPNDLSDVSIEVYPETKLKKGQAKKKAHSAETPAAIIPAHSLILANGSQYFRALFTNGMAQSLSRGDGVTDDEQKLVTKPSTVVVKVKGYNKMTLEGWEQVLRIADEYGAASLFDHVSYLLLAKYLDPKSAHKNVIDLLTMAYKYSRETSEILRKGCISYCGEKYLKVLRDAAFQEFLSQHACRDLLLGMTLQFKKVAVESDSDSDSEDSE